MLNAVLYGKKRGTGLEGTRLLEDFTGSEDILTSTVFERLLYLPDGVIIDILFGGSIWGDTASTKPGKIIDYEFWPRWEPTNFRAATEQVTDAQSGESGVPQFAREDQQSIEPDLRIEFDDRVLVIEAKRWDFRAMHLPREQLSRQYVRASSRFAGKPAWLLAVGGLSDTRRITKNALRDCVLSESRELGWTLPAEDFHFAALAWYELFKIVVDVARNVAAYRRLLDDLQRGLSEHGIHVEPPQWLGDLASGDWCGTLGSITSSPTAFRPNLATILSPITIRPSSIATFCPEESE